MASKRRLNRLDWERAIMWIAQVGVGLSPVVGGGPSYHHKAGPVTTASDKFSYTLTFSLAVAGTGLIFQP